MRSSEENGRDDFGPDLGQRGAVGGLTSKRRGEVSVCIACMYVDCNSFGPRAIEAAAGLYGAERIVCGTDGTAFGCDWTTKAVAEAQIGEDAREKILHRDGRATSAGREAGKSPRVIFLSSAFKRGQRPERGVAG